MPLKMVDLSSRHALRIDHSRVGFGWQVKHRTELAMHGWLSGPAQTTTHYPALGAAPEYGPGDAEVP